MSIFTDALSAGLAAVAETAGDPVEYARGEIVVQLVAVKGHSRHESDDARGQAVTTMTVDFLVATADFLAAGLELPDRGDVVRVGAGVAATSHEVRKPDGADAAWRYMDAGRTRIRIHTTSITETP